MTGNPRACCPLCNRHVGTFLDSEPRRRHYLWHTVSGRAWDQAPCEGSGWLVEDVELLLAEMGNA